MRRWAGVLIPVAGTTALLAVVGVASSQDGKAAFERREDTMKHMGRPFYLGIGRVVKGTAAYGPDTITAAETVASIASTLDRTLFRRVPMSPRARSNRRSSPPMVASTSLSRQCRPLPRSSFRRSRPVTRRRSPRPIPRSTTPAMPAIRNFDGRSDAGTLAVVDRSGTGADTAGVGDPSRSGGRRRRARRVSGAGGRLFLLPYRARW